MDLIIENHQCAYVIYGWIIYLDCIDISTDVSQDIYGRCIYINRYCWYSYNNNNNNNNNDNNYRCKQ